MAKIYGTIESLKSLKTELHKNRITRFNSVKEIKDFLSNYDSEKHNILENEAKILEKEYTNTCVKLIQKKKNRTATINSETKKIEKIISDLQYSIDTIKLNTNFFKKFVLSIKLYSLKKESNYYIKHKTRLINSSVKVIDTIIENDEIFIKNYKTDKQKIIYNRSKSKIRKLESTKSILQNCSNLISGAIGENLVVKELKKLPDDFVLINDFKINFSSPIYYNKLDQRIYSIQIDHLLISKAGIFIIETKNWSKSSINSLSLRSPIEQIRRANFGLYVFISENISLNDHHWGEQRVPIRNLIVMINHKPKGQFKYVSIKLLKEINDYIHYFEPVLSNKQFNSIVTKLK